METTKNMIYSQLTMFMRERERENKKKAFTTSVVTVVQLLSPVWLFATLWTAAHHVPLSYTFSQSLFTLMFTESVVPSDHLKHSCHFSFCLQCLLAWESFSMSWLFASGGQSIGVSASAAVLQRNIQGWLPLGLFDLLAVQGTLKSLLQHHNLKASILGCSAFFESLVCAEILHSLTIHLNYKPMIGIIITPSLHMRKLKWKSIK